MSSVADASAITTLAVDEALDNMEATIHKETVCIACCQSVAANELKLVCLSRCNMRLALPGCLVCFKCMKSKVHIGEFDSEAGVWSCALCPKSADKFEAAFIKDNQPIVKWIKLITERRATSNKLCFPAQSFMSGPAFKSLEVQIERAKTASTADKRVQDHAIAKATAKIEQLNGALAAAQATAAAAPTAALGTPMCLEGTPSEEAEDAAEAAAEVAAAREAEQAAHQERIEAQRRETERRREEDELASLAATAEERAASEAHKQRMAAEKELREAQAATAAANAAAAAAASPPDTPAGRSSAKSRFLAKEGNTEEMWLQKQADAVAKAKATRKRKADQTTALEDCVARGKTKRRLLRLKLERLKELARSMGASAEAIGDVASDDEEEGEEEQKEGEDVD